MTEVERLALLLVCDTVLAAADNPCQRVSVDALRKARHALDDEAFREARGPIQTTIGGVGAALGSLLAPGAVDAADADDEFFRGVWWVPDEAPGVLRPATGSECAAEIIQLRAAVCRIIEITSRPHGGQGRAHAALSAIDGLAREALRC